MGKFQPPFSYTGTVSNLSVYKVRGSDTPIVRTKGGPTKRMIKTRPSFATTRKNNMEFGGRARVAGQVLDILRPLKYLGDYNLAGPLNSLLIPIQALDTINEHGSVMWSSAKIRICYRASISIAVRHLKPSLQTGSGIRFRKRQ